MTTAQPMQFTGNTFDQRRHICAFFNSSDEQHRVLRSFIKDGFDLREKAFHLVDPERQDEHLGWLAEAGIDVHEAMGAGQLEVRPWQDGPLRGGRFDQEIWLTSFEQALQSGPAAGYPRTRFFAHMEWALVDLPGVDDLILSLLSAGCFTRTRSSFPRTSCCPRSGNGGRPALADGASLKPGGSAAFARPAWPGGG
jgi:hypothetical protein